MQLCYGSTVDIVVHAQTNDPQTYGPGWEVDSARRFLARVNDRYPGMRLFLNACRHIADELAEAAPDDSCRGDVCWGG
jgi:uncharacterized protein YukE